jgi:hypothetical protein
MLAGQIWIGHNSRDQIHLFQSQRDILNLVQRETEPLYIGEIIVSNLNIASIDTVVYGLGIVHNRVFSVGSEGF